MDNFQIYNYIKAKKGGSSADIATLDALIDRSLTTINNSRVTSIGAHAFRNCTNLTTVKFDKVVSIGGSAFTDCTGLTTLILSINSVAPLLNTSVLSNTRIAKGAGYIYVPDELVDDYKTATNWTVYEDQIKGLSQLPEGV